MALYNYERIEFIRCTALYEDLIFIFKPYNSPTLRKLLDNDSMLIESKNVLVGITRITTHMKYYTSNLYHSLVVMVAIKEGQT